MTTADTTGDPREAYRAAWTDWQAQLERLHALFLDGERLPPQIWNAWEAAGGHPILDGLGCSELVYMVIGNTPNSFTSTSNTAGVRNAGSVGPSRTLRTPSASSVSSSLPTPRTGQIVARIQF